MDGRETLSRQRNYALGVEASGYDLCLVTDRRRICI